MNKISLIICLKLIALSLVFNSNFVCANNKLNQAEQQYKQITEQEIKLKQNLQNTKKQKNIAQKKLNETQKQITNLQNEINSLTKNQQNIENKIKELIQNEQQLNAEISQQYQLIAKQMRATFIGKGNNEPFKLLLNSQNLTQIMRNVTYYQYLAVARKKQLEQFEQSLQKLENNKQQINQKKNEQQNQLVTLNDKKKQLEQIKHTRTKLVKQLSSEEIVTSNKITKNQQQQENIRQLIKKIENEIAVANRAKNTLNKGEFAKMRGKLKMPVYGKIGAKFGAKRGNSGSSWDGVVIESAEGNFVKAIYNGKIVYSDWLSGMGFLMIIDHGSGYLSLYGYNQKLLKSIGDMVITGENIATVGSNVLNKPATYFAIRYQGRAQNPTLWCK